MPRGVVIPRLGVGGRNTDKPTWALDATELADGSTDGVIYEGALRRRRGFADIGIDAAGADAKALSVYRWRSALTGITATMYHYSVNVSSNGLRRQKLFIQTDPVRAVNWNPSVPQLGSFYSDATYVPRAVYNDELLWCAQDGFNFMLRCGNTGGSAIFPSGTGAATTAAGQSIVSWATSLTAAKGQYLLWNAGGATGMGYLSFKITEVAALSVTLEGVKTSVAINPNPGIEQFGFTYPGVSVYSQGTITTAAAAAVTGVGTKFESTRRNGFQTAMFPTHLIPDGGPGVAKQNYSLLSIASETSALGGHTVNQTNVSYHFTRPCSFRDVCVHNETLYGIGVDAYPSRVYVAPAAWNMSAPPGALLPFDPSIAFSSTSINDLLLDFIDVPSPFDADPCVAILATDGPRLVLKRNSVHGLYQEPPLLSQRVIHSGDGCIDIRSAISVKEGAFWAGEDGVYRYHFGRFEDLTEGRMRNEWRALTSAGVDYCAIGVDGRNLVVSIKTADASQQRRTYVYDLDLQRWLPELTNIYPRHMFTANITDEITQLLYVDDALPTKVLNMKPALDLSGPARDPAGSGPSFRAITGDNLIQADGIEGDARVVEASIHAVVEDGGGTTTLNAKMVLGGSLYGRNDGQGFNYDSGVNYDTGAYWGPDGCKDMGNLASNTHDQVVRYEFPVNRTARRARLEVAETTTSQTVGDVELGEVVIRMKDLQRAT